MHSGFNVTFIWGDGNDGYYDFKKAIEKIPGMNVMLPASHGDPIIIEYVEPIVKAEPKKPAKGKK